jgi:quaternary ammonium compound-resistance protein SugE
MNWVVLILAGLLEVVWALGLKQSAGFSRLAPSVITIAAMLASFYLLALALKTLPLGTAYAVWVGIGTVGTVIAGTFFLGENLSALKLVSVVLIVAGIAGLKLANGA